MHFFIWADIQNSFPALYMMTLWYMYYSFHLATFPFQIKHITEIISAFEIIAWQNCSACERQIDITAALSFGFFFLILFYLVWMLSELLSKIALSVAPQYIYCCSQRFTYNVHSTIYFFFFYPHCHFCTDLIQQKHGFHWELQVEQFQSSL